MDNYKQKIKYVNLLLLALSLALIAYGLLLLNQDFYLVLNKQNNKYQASISQGGKINKSLFSLASDIERLELEANNLHLLLKDDSNYSFDIKSKKLDSLAENDLTTYAFLIIADNADYLLANPRYYFKLINQQLLINDFNTNATFDTGARGDNFEIHFSPDSENIVIITANGKELLIFNLKNMYLVKRLTLEGIIEHISWGADNKSIYMVVKEHNHYQAYRTSLDLAAMKALAFSSPYPFSLFSLAAKARMNPYLGQYSRGLNYLLIGVLLLVTSLFLIISSKQKTAKARSKPISQEYLETELLLIDETQLLEDETILLDDETELLP